MAIKSTSNSTAFDTFCQVSNEDLDRVEGPILNMNKEFYIVRDSQDNLIEYQVHDLSTCTCKSPNCEHITLAVAADIEHRLAIAIQTLFTTFDALEKHPTDEILDHHYMTARDELFAILKQSNESVTNIWTYIDCTILAKKCTCNHCGRPATHADLKNVGFKCNHCE